MKVKVGILQANLIKGDVEKNYQIIERMIREAAKRGANIVCTPEACLDGWSFDRKIIERTAEPIPGKTTAKFVSLVKELGIYLVACFFETDKGKIYNTAIVLNPKGELLGKYRKIHLTLSCGEDKLYDAGDEFFVFSTNFGKVGIMICHDRQIPESARVLRLMEADIIFCPTQTRVFSKGPNYINQAMMRTRAYENEVYLVCVNSASIGHGGSLVVDPMGNVLIEGGRSEEVIVCEINTEIIEKVREKKFSKDEANALDLSGVDVRERNPKAYTVLCE